MISRTRTSRTASTHRSGFTIPELLVVTVIALILMSILSIAHSIGLDALRNAKAQGDLVDQQRMAISVIRRDLLADRFLEEDGKPNQGRKLSDQHFHRLYVNNAVAPPRLAGYRPPRSGYFLAYSPVLDNVSDIYEGTDSDGFASTRSGNHFLQFTMIVSGGAPENTITADVPFLNGSQFIGRAAEVSYFLVQNGTTPSGVKKYNLIRRQRLAALNNDDAPGYSSRLAASGAAATDPPEVMAVGAANKVFNLNELTFAGNRLVRAPIATHRVGEDILLSNVTSFELKFTGPTANGVSWPAPETSTQWPRPFTTNTDYPYDSLPYDGVFDTFNQGPGWDNPVNLATAATPSAALKRIRITGVSIRLRGWDQKTKSTRQTTMIVDL